MPSSYPEIKPWSISRGHESSEAAKLASVLVVYDI